MITIFQTIIIKALPLYLLVLLGWILGKKQAIDNKTVSLLLMYVLSPAVFLYSSWIVKLDGAIIFLPVIIFTISSFLNITFYRLGKRVFSDNTANLLGFTAGNANSGYFGIPLIASLFSEATLAAYVMSMIGFVLCQNTVGFYIVARGKFTVKESIQKLFGLPILYCFGLGLTLNYSKISPPQEVINLFTNFKGGYSVLGMMLVGLGLSKISNLNFDLKFTGYAFLAKFIFWPLILISLMVLDTNYFHLLPTDLRKSFIILSLVPMAADTVTFSTALGVQPEKAAFAVLLSTVFSLLYIPLIYSIVVGIFSF